MKEIDQMSKTRDPLLNKLPPQSIEAEESLLSAILIDNSVLDDVTEILTPDDFYKSAHQKIFSAIIELSKYDEPADLVTLTNKLRGKDDLIWINSLRVFKIRNSSSLRLGQVLAKQRLPSTWHPMQHSENIFRLLFFRLKCLWNSSPCGWFVVNPE
jgi:hypothetical protein